MANVLEQFSTELAGLSHQVMASLVQIRRGGRGIGAGTIWHADGLIVTNAHVVEAGGQVSTGLTVAMSNGQELPARVLAVDSEHDLAALAVDAQGLPTTDLGDSRRLQPGEVVMAMGFPFGVSGGATVGTVIGVGSDVTETRGRGLEWLVASLHLRPGHSGGPMVDALGRLVGINTMMNGPDVGVAVPVHVAKEFLKRVVGQPPPTAAPAISYV